MKNRICLLIISGIFSLLCAGLEAAWPLYYQPSSGPPIPTPEPISHKLTGSYCDLRAREIYEYYHTGVDLGLGDQSTTGSDYVVFPVEEGIIKDIDQDFFWGHWGDVIIISSGENRVFFYTHLDIDQDNLTEGQRVYPHDPSVPGSGTALGILVNRGTPPYAHLHLAVFDRDKDKIIWNPLPTKSRVQV